MKNKPNKITLIAISATLIIGFAIGYLANGTTEKSSSRTGADSSSASLHQPESEATIWTCSMHPQVRLNEPGDCPICGMTLIPLESMGENEPNMDAIAMSPTAMKIANVETMDVGTGRAVKEIKLTGKITADERRNAVQVSHFPGRIEKLNINFTGEYVKKGQTIGQIYSPALVTAQKELLEAQKMRDTQPELYAAAMQKLHNWKLGDSEIQEILKANKVKETLPIHADISGYVSQKMINPGDYVKTGEPLYQIYDLSKVWVQFDVYESELKWVAVGDEIDFTIASLPGRHFTKTIDFLDPLINSDTRVARARVELENDKGLFKPEMLVSGVVKTALPGAEGISVPKSAVMWTGKRSVVYVKSVSRDGVYFNMREVTLGPELGESYVIEDGLKVGESIAVNGTFSIDAAAQLAGKPSMMDPEGSDAMSGQDHGGMDMTRSTAVEEQKSNLNPEAYEALNSLVETYLVLKDALTKDQFDSAKIAIATLETKLRNIDMKAFQNDAHATFMVKYNGMLDGIALEQPYENIGAVRKSFKLISDNLISLLHALHYKDENLHVDYCPMAFHNLGAKWLSIDRDIRNPYFGEEMLTCGEIKSHLK